ncbi:uncharacterized protein LOC130138025 [Syzygium oleosum]|uniref:uncharacterized protein LOC130138025 n=1 Tax=Syzygium oleosum TaxID=219896 RepID=UPI0024B8D3C0|nr:uncharacterized protein LOC130138025 [Syzygium oleosum]
MEEARKRQADGAADGGGGGGGDPDAKKPRPAEARAEPQSGGGAGQDEDDDDCILAWLALDDDAVSELLNLLEPAESPPCSSSPSSAAGGGAAFNFKVRFIDDPYASPVVFQSSSSFVTINGNEESCGSSFSESESTVMASIDTRGIGALRGGCGDAEAGRDRGPEVGGAWASGSEEGEAPRGCGVVLEGWDCLFGADADDDAVAGFLGVEEEEGLLLTGLK